MLWSSFQSAITALSFHFTVSVLPQHIDGRRVVPPRFTWPPIRRRCVMGRHASMAPDAALLAQQAALALIIEALLAATAASTMLVLVRVRTIRHALHQQCLVSGTLNFLLSGLLGVVRYWLDTGAPVTRSQAVWLAALVRMHNASMLLSYAVGLALLTCGVLGARWHNARNKRNRVTLTFVCVAIGTAIYVVYRAIDEEDPTFVSIVHALALFALVATAVKRLSGATVALALSVFAQANYVVRRDTVASPDLSVRLTTTHIRELCSVGVLLAAAFAALPGEEVLEEEEAAAAATADGAGLAEDESANAARRKKQD